MSAFSSLQPVQSLAFTIVIAIFVITFLLQAFQIPSASMEGTLLTGDYLLVDKSTYGGGAGPAGRLLPYEPVRRGDVIVFHSPVKPELYFVKRVVGVPGDRVRIADKQLFVNSRIVLEDYTQHQLGTDAYRDNFPQFRFASANVNADWWREMRRLTNAQGDLVVPAGRYFVLGDNRDDSQDSRYWGLVPRENIVGRPLLIYWSLRSDGGPTSVTAARGDTLSGFAYAVTHLHRYTRWERTFRIVR